MSSVVPSITGLSARHVQWAICKLVGDGGFDASMGAITPEARACLSNARKASWVPIDAMGELFDAARAQSGLSEEELVGASIRMATERTMFGLFRALLRLTTDQALITRAPILWKRIRNIGRVEVTKHRRGGGVLEVHGWPEMSERSAYIVAVNIESVLRCAGRKDVTVDWTREANGARYEIDWPV